MPACAGQHFTRNVASRAARAVVDDEVLDNLPFQGVGGLRPTLKRPFEAHARIADAQALGHEHEGEACQSDNSMDPKVDVARIESLALGSVG